MMGNPTGPGYINGSNYTTNYADYNAFSVTASVSSNGTQVAVTVQNVLSNLTYIIWTNSVLGPTSEWGIWQTVTATNSVIVAPAFTIGSNAVFFQASMVWCTCPNESAMPDSMSMLEYNSLCVPTNGGYITNGMVAYWRLNDRTGDAAADSSGNNLALPLTNSPAWGSDYLTLNGSSQYGDAGSNALTILDTNDMTICAWINTLSTNLQGIVAKDYYITNGDYGGWCLAIQNNQLIWNLETGPLNDTGIGIVPLGQWVFVAVTWSYRNISNYEACFYINGQLNSSKRSAGNPSLTEEPSGWAHLFLGNLQDVDNDYENFPFDGSMRDVAIYNCVLSTNQILSNFFNTEPSTNVQSPDLLYYKMTESNQTSVTIYLTNSCDPEGAKGEYPCNSSVIWTNGPGGESNALHFDGTCSYIETQLSAPFDFTINLFTVNLWVDPNSSTNHYLLQNQDSAGTNGWYLYYDATYRVIFGTVTGGVANTIRPQEVGAQNLTWDMVTVVRTSLTNAIIYLNGLAAASGNITSPGSSINTLKLCVDPAFTNFYDGNLWLPQIWCTNLSPSDIANLFHRQKNGSPWPP